MAATQIITYNSFQHLLTFNVKRLNNIMIDQLKVFMANPVLHVSFSPGEEVVHHSHLMAVHHQFVSQMGANKTGSSGDLVKTHAQQLSSLVFSTGLKTKLNKQGSDLNLYCIFHTLRHT